MTAHRLGFPSPADEHRASAAVIPFPDETNFERRWRTLPDPERRRLIEGYVTGPMADQLMTEKPFVVEMALRSYGYKCRDYVGLDYEKIGTKQSTEWGE